MLERTSSTIPARSMCVKRGARVCNVIQFPQRRLLLSGCSLKCPGLGSSSSSTSPNPFGSEPSPRGSAVAGPVLSIWASIKGDGGGLRDCDRRASSCKKGIGENKGVDGVDGNLVFPIAPDAIVLLLFVSLSIGRGKDSQVDVTSKDFSTARKYLPRYL